MAPGTDTREIKCDSPKCKKKMTGATLEGVRKSMVCHWAIAHEELKDVLVQDADISEDFVERLYADQRNRVVIQLQKKGLKIHLKKGLKIQLTTG